MSYGNKMKKTTPSTTHNSKTTEAAKGVETPYKGFVGQRQAYKITGKVVGQK